MSDPLISSFVRRRNGPALVLHPAAFFQRLVDDVEQLSVHAAKLVGGPLLDRFHPPGIDPQYERFLFYLFSHPPCLSSLLVQRSGIHDRLRLFVGTEHHQQISYHRRFLIFVEIDHLFGGQPIERHLHHRHRSLHDLFAGRNDRGSLLPAQHHRGDLRRIGQVIDSRFDHFDPGDRQPN